VGKEHPITATTLFVLGDLYVLQGQLDEAEPILKRVLAMREKLLGPSHAEVANTLDRLANIAIARARYAEAERILQRVLAIREPTLGANHHDTAMTLVQFSRIRHAQARYAEAEDLTTRALAVLRKGQGPVRMLAATALNNLAVLFQQQGKLAPGLARAFFYAGSRTLLASHWYVDSEAAVALVTKAFGEINARPGIGRAEALRRAMLALIDQGGRTAHPANWAPFVVVGEGGR
jgi:tetratricopeptide (TPR) repeat protein